MTPDTKFSVCVDHLTDAQLETFGWYRIDEDDEFIIYLSPHYGEHQVVSQARPRVMLVDDVNDARQMSDGGGPPLVLVLS